MKQNLLNKKIRPQCAYCAIGRPGADGAHVLCVKKGVMQADSHCRHFSYDPLKRVPEKKLTLPLYDPSEFTLE